MSELKSIFRKVNDEEKEILLQKINTRYLILYYLEEDGKELQNFEIIKGRINAYTFLKDLVEVIDLKESKVLTDNVPLKDAISVYEFMKHVSELIEDETFNIDDYYIEGDVEDEE